MIAGAVPTEHTTFDGVRVPGRGGRVPRHPRVR
jgi:hypothetical protein